MNINRISNLRHGILNSIESKNLAILSFIPGVMPSKSSAILPLAIFHVHGTHIGTRKFFICSSTVCLGQMHCVLLWWCCSRAMLLQHIQTKQRKWIDFFLVVISFIKDWALFKSRRKETGSFGWFVWSVYVWKFC